MTGASGSQDTKGKQKRSDWIAAATIRQHRLTLPTPQTGDCSDRPPSTGYSYVAHHSPAEVTERADVKPIGEEADVRICQGRQRLDADREGRRKHAREGLSGVLVRRCEKEKRPLRGELWLTPSAFPKDPENGCGRLRMQGGLLAFVKNSASYVTVSPPHG
eukprot:scaffold47_cov258-Pinguiococcus_pyrenoidosus.AAC.60